jgi:hypothetical protein
MGDVSPDVALPEATSTAAHRWPKTVHELEYPPAPSGCVIGVSSVNKRDNFGVPNFMIFAQHKCGMADSVQ